MVAFVVSFVADLVVGPPTENKNERLATKSRNSFQKKRSTRSALAYPTRSLIGRRVAFG